jgi:hypothetical protein
VTRVTDAFAVGGAIAASLFTIASAQSVRVGDDWVTLPSAEGGFHVLMPPDWKEDDQGMQAPVSVSDPASQMRRRHRISSTARLKPVPIPQSPPQLRGR